MEERVECKNCHKKYYYREIQYPAKDHTDGVSCPYCGHELISPRKGTKDYEVYSEDEYKNM